MIGTHLVREGQGQLDLVRGDVGVGPPGRGVADGGGADSECRADDAEGTHGGY